VSSTGKNFLKKVSEFAKQISSEPLFKNFQVNKGTRCGANPTKTPQKLCHFIQFEVFWMGFGGDCFATPNLFFKKGFPENSLELTLT